MRFVPVIVLLGILAFSAFGFLATFEPLEREQQVFWRSIYGVCFAASLGGLVWVFRKDRTSS